MKKLKKTFYEVYTRDDIKKGLAFRIYEGEDKAEADAKYRGCKSAYIVRVDRIIIESK